MPSTGIFSPGRTRNRSPGCTCSSGISCSLPSRRMRAVFGVRSSKARIAAPVRLRARSSSTWPSSTNVVIAAAASKYTAGIPSISRNDAGKIPGARVAATLYAYAAPVPSAMRVNMLVERLTTELQPRWKKGHPPQSTTGVASSNSIHGSQPPGSACCTGIPGNMSAIAIPSSGSVSARLIQNRRVISRSSGFSSASAVTVRRSSAMPQMGHDPGPVRTISGCIGQVYSTRFAVTGASGSSAIPHRGQAPELLSRTSGHIGHT